MHDDAIVLLGEVHDNAELQRQRWAVLRDALRSGWRPAFAMEQFDIDRQADIERARRARPRDVAHLIATATPAPSGWDWDLYRPVIALALEHGLPLLAANLPPPLARRLVEHDAVAVFGAARARELALVGPDAVVIDAAWQAAQQHEIDVGHCGVLPPALLPGMARAQFARDAVMADVLQRHAGRGIVLLAGNGHVRKDLGVPRWLRGSGSWSVGFIEAGSATRLGEAFDALVVGPDLARGDPCAEFRRPLPSGRVVSARGSPRG